LIFLLLILLTVAVAFIIKKFINQKDLNKRIY